MFLHPQKILELTSGGHFEISIFKTRAHSIIARRRIMIKKVKSNVIT